MKTNIYFTRHAECQSNIDPFFTGDLNGLTEKGVNQAKVIGQYFKNRNISDVFTSDILRAKETAKEIYFPKEPIVLNFLKERSVIYQNTAEYLPKEDYKTFEQRLSESKTFLENLPEGNFVVVSHAIFLKALISCLLLNDSSNEEYIEEISSHLIIDNASISKFIFNKEKNKWKVDYINKKII